MIDPNNLPRSSLQAGVDRKHLIRLLGAVGGFAAVLAVLAIVLLLIG